MDRSWGCRHPVTTLVFQRGETGARIGHPGGHLERTTLTRTGKQPRESINTGWLTVEQDGFANQKCAKIPPRRPSQVQRRRSRCLWGVAEAPLPHQGPDRAGAGGSRRTGLTSDKAPRSSVSCPLSTFLSLSMPRAGPGDDWSARRSSAARLFRVQAPPRPAPLHRPASL